VDPLESIVNTIGVYLHKKDFTPCRVRVEAGMLHGFARFNRGALEIATSREWPAMEYLVDLGWDAYCCNREGIVWVILATKRLSRRRIAKKKVRYFGRKLSEIPGYVVPEVDIPFLIRNV
jgi:DNA-directed RNA polymerase subunit N (RpoN/RPB10)